MRILLLLLALVVVGCVALPVSAFLLDGTDTGENLIVPVQVLVTAAVGAVLGSRLLASSSRRRALTGAGLGVLGAAVGVGVFFLLLNGVDGA
ncbi:hypothetical protein [Nocardioides nitrophenolicus]|uniref:hypothetical protein n=1 Tax=Nocardioides nitrophenolicus TaxID=60489 RepID=UPI001958DE26|nr:hypothetical protein [Nocardioides nitrophenolicus]MBM7516908.1 putative effector of murein hydrolase [Nocardioides nitrophenolicus]